ncbi:MAG: hypothetical protein ACFB6R_13020 [Alphaproteobacteria bacterium]
MNTQRMHTASGTLPNGSALARAVPADLFDRVRWGSTGLLIIALLGLVLLLRTGVGMA